MKFVIKTLKKLGFLDSYHMPFFMQSIAIYNLKHLSAKKKHNKKMDQCQYSSITSEGRTKSAINFLEGSQKYVSSQHYEGKGMQVLCFHDVYSYKILVKNLFS